MLYVPSSNMSIFEQLLSTDKEQFHSSSSSTSSLSVFQDILSSKAIYILDVYTVLMPKINFNSKIDLLDQDIEEHILYLIVLGNETLRGFCQKEKKKSSDNPSKPA